MKTITNNLSRVILAIAAVALIIGVVLSFTAPIGDFFGGTIGKLDEVGNGKIWEVGGYNPGGGATEQVYYSVMLMASPTHAGSATFAANGQSTMSLTGENTVTVSATENDGFSFTGWYGSDAALLSVNRNYSPTVASETTLTAVYLEPGLYDANDNMLASWDELVNTYGLDIEKDYTKNTYATTASSAYSVFKKSALKTGVELVIPNGVTKIGNYAFTAQGTDYLINITIPDSVTSIGTSAFEGCTSLISVTWGTNSQLTTIGDYAFRGCALNYFDIPDNVTSIGFQAFNNVGVTELYIPANVTSIGENAIINCANLETITVAANNPVYHSEGNCLIETATNKLLAGCKNSEIPDYVTTIGVQAFLRCDLTSVTIPDSVTTIELGAFGESSLTNIYIPDTVTTIGAYAFMNCNNLTSIEIPGGVTTIDEGTFAYSALERIVISEGVTTIASTAFANCAALEEVFIPTSVTYIGETAFYECASLTTINYAGTVEEWNNNITFGEYWSYNAPVSSVICSNGTVTVG